MRCWAGLDGINVKTVWNMCLAPCVWHMVDECGEYIKEHVVIRRMSDEL